jgi:hypothetical protein
MVRDSTSIGLEGSWRFVVPTLVFGLGGTLPLFSGSETARLPTLVIAAPECA